MLRNSYVYWWILGEKHPVKKGPNLQRGQGMKSVVNFELLLYYTAFRLRPVCHCHRTLGFRPFLGLWHHSGSVLLFTVLFIYRLTYCPLGVRVKTSPGVKKIVNQTLIHLKLFYNKTCPWYASQRTTSIWGLGEGEFIRKRSSNPGKREKKIFPSTSSFTTSDGFRSKDDLISIYL